MAKRMTLMLALVAVLLFALGFAKLHQTRAEAAKEFSPPPEAVTTTVAQQEQWLSTLSAIGTMAPVQGVMIGADLPGTVARIAFESGSAVRQGDVLVELDTRQERAQLAAAEADRVLAGRIVKRMQAMWDQGVISRTDYDRAIAEDEQSAAKVGEIRAAIERKTIRAPFTGILGIRQVNLGQYLSAGTAVVQLQALDPIYVNFSVPQQQAAAVQIGLPVHITSGATATSAGAGFEGRVTAVDSIVDAQTRNLSVQATFANPERHLRPGMFVQAEVNLDASSAAIALPRSAISYAPYGDSIYVVEELRDAKGQTYRGVQQRFVKLGEARGDQIAVLAGVEPGDEVVTSGVFKLRNGAAVLVDNTVQPGNDPAPAPENS
jgi:membrane fusion protein (multidrug efflux system)